jgi:NADH:ubiquinone oxidoreductase subunit 6 (subunit J)
MVFYSSLVLGIIFTAYGSALIGVFEIITFAGAVSVLLLTAVLMTGESRLDIGASKTKLILVAASVAVVTVATFTILAGLPSGSASQTSVNLVQFVWEFRPWDLLILVVIFASAMVVVSNLSSQVSQ